MSTVAEATAPVAEVIKSLPPEAAAPEKEKISTTITLDTKAEISREGNVTVSLKQVDPTRFKNYRQEAKEAHIMELMGLLKEHNQLNSCLGAWQKDGTIALVAGFCRFEAMLRLALTPLINEYNKFNNKQPGDEGYIAPGGFGFKSHENRLKVRQAGGEWTAKYDAALAGYNINFTTVIVEDEADAALMNIASNAYDKPPLMDLCRQIESLLKEGNITAKRVAKSLKMSETVVSLHRKINATPAHLRELFKGDLSELKKNPEEQQVLRDGLMTAVGELEKRLSLEQENPQSISYSHAREFAGAVISKEPMTLAGTVKALRDLVVISDNGKLSDAATPDYTVFMAKLREAKRIGKAPEPTVAPGETPATAPAAAAPGATPLSDVSTLSAEQQAQFAQAGMAAAPITMPTPVVGAAVSTGNPITTTTPTVVAPPALSPEDQARQAEIDASNSEFVGTSTSALLEAEGDAGIDGGVGIATAIAAPTDGQMSGKTKDAPVAAKYKNAKPPEKVEMFANQMLDFASDTERSTIFEQGGYLLASAQLFNACGLAEAEDKVNEVFVNFMEGGNKYLLALEDTVKQARGEATLREMQQMKPTFVRPSLS